MSFEVLHPGPMSLLQDYGRLGQQHLGMSPGGPADEHAFLWANKLLNNTPTAAAIEITLGPCRLKAHAPAHIAITGADMQLQLNGHALAAWSSHVVRSGDVLEFKLARDGLRCYLAVAGGFIANPCYGSCATVVREGLGGLSGKGSALKSGDRLAFSPSKAATCRSVPKQFRPNYQQELILRLLPSYQHAQFDAEQFERLYNQAFHISPQADRMGYRLQGPTIQAPQEGLISEGIAFGAVQVPPDGHPIVLMKDRQTIGGYPKLGCVAAMDVYQLAQRRPGQSLRFRPAKLADISAQYQSFTKFFKLTHARSCSTAVL